MKTIKFIAFVLVLYNTALAQSVEEKSLQEFSSGQRSKFSSYGEGKSKGLKIHFQYPKSWQLIEGQRPHVVKTFAQTDDYALAMILINKQENEFTKKDLDETFTKEGLKTVIPEGGEYISSNLNLKIEGLKASSIEFTRSAKRVDRIFYTHVVHYIFIYKTYFVSIQFSVIDKIGETKESVDNRFKTIYPLFIMMFNSIVVDNIWEN